jgi:pimeloyl-ACP methyl ester carboxylesterase
MTFPSESIAFIFSTRRARVSSFLASEYQTTNSFLWLNDRRFSFSVSFAPSAFRSWMGISMSRFSVSGARTIVTVRSWESSSEVRERMLTAVRKTTVPIMLIHAENDYSAAPGKAMADELARLGKPHVLKIYPPVGRTADDGHNFVYTTVAEWKGDVFGFLDQYVRH